MSVKMHTDHGGTRSGFRATWKAITTATKGTHTNTTEYGVLDYFPIYMTIDNTWPY